MSMSLFTLNSSHIGSLPAPNAQHARHRKPSDQVSKRSNLSSSALHNADRKVSATSGGSIISRTGVQQIVNENIPPSSRSTSFASLTPLDSCDSAENGNRPLDIPLSRSPAARSDRSLYTQQKDALSLLAVDGTFQEIDLDSYNYQQSEDRSVKGETGVVEKQDVVPVFFDGASSLSQIAGKSQRNSTSHPSCDESEAGSNRFKRLLDNIRPQHARPKGQLTPRKERWTLDDFDDAPLPDLASLKVPRLSFHRKASSWSSEANSTPGNAQQVSQVIDPPTSQKPSMLRLLIRGSRGSKASDTAQRASVDSDQDASRIVAQVANARALQRRKILEELLSTEESYINDLKILRHAYITILTSAPQCPPLLRSEVHQNLSQMLVLHEEIVIHMKIFLRNASVQARGHHRWQSDESGPLEPTDSKKESRKSRRSLESQGSRQSRTILQTATAREAADIARVFGGMLSRFSIYEEYGARYESMLQLVASTSKAIPAWGAFERGIEALMHSLPITQVEEGKKKGLTVEDSLIKPIQRVCKYPLLFAELLRNTSAVDDADSEATIGKVLGQLKLITHDINNATNDPLIRARIQRSWQLQKLLLFPKEPRNPDLLRSLGHAKLCGLLYIVHQSQAKALPHSSYMLCALFNSHLLLAAPDSGSKHFVVKAVLNTADLDIANAHEGPGLLCRNGAHCWKLIFTMHENMHEILMCACSAQEETQWKVEMNHCIQYCKNKRTDGESTFLDLEIRVIGRNPALSETSSRGASLYNPKVYYLPMDSTQVFIKDAALAREGQSSPRNLSSSPKRSNSVQSPGHIAIMGPERAERSRFESRMDGVWTKDVLPFPGISSQRSSNFIRASKNTVFRKLSKASTNTQSSMQTISQQSIDDPFVETRAESRSSANKEESTTATPASATRSRAQTASIPFMPEDLPMRKATRGVTFTRTRYRGMSDATVKAEKDGAVEMEWTQKDSKPQKLLKAFSSDGIKTWLK